jgi:hypothetical protein
MNIFEEYKKMLEKFMKDEISSEEWKAYCDGLKNEATNAATIINSKK